MASPRRTTARAWWVVLRFSAFGLRCLLTVPKASFARAMRGAPGREFDAVKPPRSFPGPGTPSGRPFGPARIGCNAGRYGVGWKGQVDCEEVQPASDLGDGSERLRPGLGRTADNETSTWLRQIRSTMDSDDDRLDEIRSEVIELADLIDYQTDATVSRTLIDREAATLTVFAFDEGESLSEHTAPHDALLQVLDGRATITIDGEDYELEGGESIVMPADVPHAVAAETRFKMFLTMVR